MRLGSYDRRNQTWCWDRAAALRLDINIPFDLAHDDEPAANLPEDQEPEPEQPAEDNAQKNEHNHDNEGMKHAEEDPGATPREPPPAQERPAKHQRILKPSGIM